MRRKLLTLLSGLLLLGATTVAHAEIKAGSFGITPFVGGFMFDGAQHLEMKEMYGIRAGYNFTENFGIEGVFNYVHTEPTAGIFPPITKYNVYNYRGELLYHFMPKSRFVPFLAAGYGAQTIDPENAKSDSHGAFSAGGGFKYFFTDNIALRGDVRDLIINSMITPSDTTRKQTVNNLEYALGVYFQFGGEKPAPAPVPEPVVEKVAPPPPPPAPAPAPVVAPPPPPAPTSNITVTPATITRGQAATLAWTSENTTDCTVEPGGGVQTKNSMSVTPTADTTYTLTCKGPGGTTTSSANVTVQAPPPEKVCIVLGVQFDTNKAVVKPKYHDEIKKAGDFLNKYDFVTGTIDGYTDNVGTYKYNQKLSQKRAEAVREYLIKNFGIKPERLTAKGHSYDNPVASNKTAEGRAKNRRIEANFECVIQK
ncbi:MAG: OmpA family protein [Geobacter sp.]|nr:MAG: OmpA family protein [Geobacter sp.]